MTKGGINTLTKRHGEDTIISARKSLRQSPVKQPFQLVKVTIQSGPRVRVIASTLVNALPTGFTPGPFLLVPEVGWRDVFGKISLDSAGQITARTIEQAADMPSDTDQDFHVLIGAYLFSQEGLLQPENYRYGPIDATVCRNWFAAEAPFYGVTFIGS